MAAAFALVRAIRGRRGPAAAAMALGRRGGLGGADASPSPLLPMRRSLASGNGAGGTGAGGHGAGTATATGMGAEVQWHCRGAGGGVVANSGGGAGATEIHRLRKEFFEETRRLWDGYHRRCEADRRLFDELASLEMENAMNMVKAKEDLVSTTYKVLGCAGLFFIGVAASMGPYIEDSIVHDTVREVEQRLQRSSGFGRELSA